MEQKVVGSADLGSLAQIHIMFVRREIVVTGLESEKMGWRVQNLEK
jgi:hypothetical protein